MSAITKSAQGENCTINKGLMMNEYDEKWRAINGYVGLYEVSNLGRVRSLCRTVKARDGEKIIDGKLLKPSLKGSYLTVCLCNLNEETYLTIHRLVAKAFVMGFGDVVRHLDGNSLNNNHMNLAWGSHKENEADKKIHGTNINGEKHHNSVLNDELVRQIRKLYNEGHSQLKIAAFMSINRGTIGHVVRRESWAHVV